jgi:hypothetical protein
MLLPRPQEFQQPSWIPRQTERRRLAGPVVEASAFLEAGNQSLVRVEETAVRIPDLIINYIIQYIKQIWCWYSLNFLKKHPHEQK